MLNKNLAKHFNERLALLLLLFIYLLCLSLKKNVYLKRTFFVQKFEV